MRVRRVCKAMLSSDVTRERSITPRLTASAFLSDGGKGIPVEGSSISLLPLTSSSRITRTAVTFWPAPLVENCE